MNSFCELFALLKNNTLNKNLSLLYKYNSKKLYKKLQQLVQKNEQARFGAIWPNYATKPKIKKI